MVEMDELQALPIKSSPPTLTSPAMCKQTAFNIGTSSMIVVITLQRSSDHTSGFEKENKKEPFCGRKV